MSGSTIISRPASAQVDGPTLLCQPSAIHDQGAIDGHLVTYAMLAIHGARAREISKAHVNPPTTMKSRADARSAWEREHGGEAIDDEAFRRDLLPTVREASLSP